VRSDEPGDVEGVRVVRVLHRGGGPQRTLDVRPGGGEVRPPGVLHQVVGERLVGQAGVRHPGLPLQCGGGRGSGPVEAAVDLGVHPGDEEARHRVDGGQVVAVVPGGGDAVEEGGDDLPVAGHREDERDVHADALGEDLGDRREADLGGGDLDHHVGTPHPRREFLRLPDGGGGVLGEPGIDLDGHPAVHAVGGIVGVGEDVAGVPHVVDGHGEDRVGDVGAGVLQLGDLVVVGGALRHRGGEDRRVGGDADDAGAGDQVSEVTAADPVAGQVVEPDRGAGGGQRVDRGGGGRGGHR
jgi:hypothetical protein